MTQTNLQSPAQDTSRNPAWCVYSPDVDVYESDDEYLLVADLPGVSADRIALDLSNGVLSLSAELGKSGDYQSSYRRQFKLPLPVDAEHITAESKAGELTVRLTKASQARKRRIEVHSS